MVNKFNKKLIFLKASLYVKKNVVVIALNLNEYFGLEFE